MHERNPQLHAAVLADPESDTPRLVYADWLLERQDPWGELIALQIARAHDDTPARSARERELVELLPHDDYRRGFLARVRCNVRQLSRYLPEACLRELRLDCQDGEVEEVVAALPRMRLRSLALDWIRDDDLATLLPHLDATLEAFSLRPVSATRALAIMRSPLRVKTLALLDCTPEALAEISAWHPLRSLSLEPSELGMGVLERFVDAPAFAGLEHLELSHTGVGEEDVYAIAASAMPLVSLGLTGNALGAAAAHRIADTPRFAALRRLRLANCEIGDDGLEALLASPYLARELTLCLDHRTLGLPRVVEGPGNIWEEPGDPAITARVEARFAIEADGPTILREAW